MEYDALELARLITGAYQDGKNVNVVRFAKVRLMDEDNNLIDEFELNSGMIRISSSKKPIYNTKIQVFLS